MSKIYDIAEIKDIATSVAKEYGVKKIALFGSYANGRQLETSDIDLVIDKGNIKGYFMFCGFVNALEQAFGTHVDVLTYNAIKQSYICNAINDEVVLYEQ